MITNKKVTVIIGFFLAAVCILMGSVATISLTNRIHWVGPPYLHNLLAIVVICVLGLIVAIRMIIQRKAE
jgi:hypothetical protein